MAGVQQNPASNPSCASQAGDGPTTDEPSSYCRPRVFSNGTPGISESIQLDGTPVVIVADFRVIVAGDVPHHGRMIQLTPPHSLLCGILRLGMRMRLLLVATLILWRVNVGTPRPSLPASAPSGLRELWPSNPAD